MKKRAPKKHNPSSPNMEVVRAMWIEATLESKSHVSMQMVRDKFGCSTTAASDCLGRYRKVNPDVTEYDPSSKSVVAKNNFTGTINSGLRPDAVFEFVETMIDSARAVRAAA